MALNPPPLKLYDCANSALDYINELAKGQGYAVLQMARMMVEVKMPPRMACQVLAAIFHTRTVVAGPCLFSTTLLRGPLVHSSFDLNSISYTIVEIKTWFWWYSYRSCILKVWFSRRRCIQVKRTWYSNLKWKDLSLFGWGCMRINWGVYAYRLGGVRLTVSLYKSELYLINLVFLKLVGVDIGF